VLDCKLNVLGPVLVSSLLASTIFFSLHMEVSLDIPLLNASNFIGVHSRLYLHNGAKNLTFPVKDAWPVVERWLHHILLEI